MPFLQGSGAISINDIKNLFGGPGSPSLANYYRGGSYIPSTKTVTVREPSSGENYNYPNTPYTWWEACYTGSPIYSMARWQGNSYTASNTSTATSVSSGGYTYYRGSYRTTVSDPYGNGFNLYGIYRTSTSTTSINTGIPSSGQISLSQFYGAEKP